MIGVCVLFSDLPEDTKAIGPDRDLLGAALLARAIAVCGPAERQVRVVAAVPPASLEVARDEIVPRYGLVEVGDTVAAEGSFEETLKQALEMLGDDADIILVHDGRRPLVSHAMTLSVMEAASDQGAAALAIDAPSSVVRSDDAGLLFSLSDQAMLLQSPQAAKRELVLRALEQSSGGAKDLFDLLTAADIPVACVSGDVDNLRIVAEADVTRAIEVWSRRAVDYPFLWPRPDRVEEARAEAGDEDESGGMAPSEAMDQMLANAGDEEGRAGPLDQAIATLTEGDPELDDAAAKAENSDRD